MYMEGKDTFVGVIVILGIIAIALFGGSKNAGSNGLLSSGNATPEQKRQDVAKEIQKTQAKVDILKKQIQAEEDKKTQSRYKGVVSLSYVNRSTDPSREYLTIRVDNKATTTIPVTGWRLTSTNTGNSVAIPKGTYLFFTGVLNSEEDIYLTGGDTLYLVTGISPNGVSFKSNKCSGYLTQFQTFVPYISNICPLARDEGVESIQKIVSNDACLDYINSYPRCRTETKNLPVTWTYECKHFITDKLSYPSCVNSHKNDKDFYQHEWRIYLKRSAVLWKDRRENIILYDNLGKVVSTLTY